jgi:membrane protein DedA with SNARE-associated domain
VTHFLMTTVADHGYLAVFVLMVLESMFIPIPSEVVMLFGGALAGGLLAGSGHAHVDLVGIGLVGTAGNLVGSLGGYAIGRYGGQAVVSHRSVSWLIRPHHVERAEQFFARRGSVAVFVGRLAWPRCRSDASWRSPPWAACRGRSPWRPSATLSRAIGTRSPAASRR